MSLFLKEMKKFDKRLIISYKNFLDEEQSKSRKLPKQKLLNLIRQGVLRNPLKVTTSKKEIKYNTKLIRAISDGFKSVLSVFHIPYKKIINFKSVNLPTLDLIKIIKYEINRPMSLLMENDCESFPKNYFNIFDPEIYKLLQRITKKKTERTFSFCMALCNLKRCAPVMPEIFKKESLEKHKKTLSQEPNLKLSKKDSNNFRNMVNTILGKYKIKKKQIFLANASATYEIPFSSGGARSVLNDIEELKEEVEEILYEQYEKDLETLIPFEEYLEIVGSGDYRTLDEQYDPIEINGNWFMINLTKEKQEEALKRRNQLYKEFKLINPYEGAQNIVFDRELEKYKKIHHNSPKAKVSVVQDPMKSRVISKEPTLHHFLKPIHQRIIDIMVAKYKVFSPLLEGINPYTFTYGFQKNKDQIFGSVDYEAATDNVLPEFFQIFHKCLLKRTTDPGITYLLEQNMKMRTLVYPDGSTVEQKNGQLMGSYMSSIVLNLYNLYGVMKAIYPNIDYSNKKLVDALIKKLGKQAKFCGDDLIILATRKQLNHHKTIVKDIGMTLSKGKSYENPRFGIFCSLCFCYNGSYDKREFDPEASIWIQKSYNRFDIVKFPMVQFLVPDEVIDDSTENRNVPGGNDEFTKIKRAKTYTIDQKLQMLTVAIKGKRSKFSQNRFYDLFMEQNRSHLSKSCRSLWAPKEKNGFGLPLKYYKKVLNKNKNNILKRNISKEAVELWFLSNEGKHYVPKYQREVDSLFQGRSKKEKFHPMESYFEIHMEHYGLDKIYGRPKVELTEVGKEDRKFLRSAMRRIRDEYNIKAEQFQDLFFETHTKLENIKESNPTSPNVKLLQNLELKYFTIWKEASNYVETKITEARSEMHDYLFKIVEQAA